jgi:hypothetical protein
MRTTPDLIRELADESERLTLVALVVGFEDHTEFVFYRPNADQPLLTELNQHIQQGGEPIGFIGVLQTSEGEGRVYHCALAEYADEPWVEPYLVKLLDRVREQFVAHGIRADFIHPDRN